MRLEFVQLPERGSGFACETLTAPFYVDLVNNYWRVPIGKEEMYEPSHF